MATILGSTTQRKAKSMNQWTNQSIPVSIELHRKECCDRLKMFSINRGRRIWDNLLSFQIGSGCSNRFADSSTIGTHINCTHVCWQLFISIFKEHMSGRSQFEERSWECFIAAPDIFLKLRGRVKDIFLPESESQEIQSTYQWSKGFYFPSEKTVKARGWKVL